MGGGFCMKLRKRSCGCYSLYVDILCFGLVIRCVGNASALCLLACRA